MVEWKTKRIARGIKTGTEVVTTCRSHAALGDLIMTGPARFVHRHRSFPQVRLRNRHGGKIGDRESGSSV
jgi:hypothetical protein